MWLTFQPPRKTHHPFFLPELDSSPPTHLLQDKTELVVWRLIHLKFTWKINLNFSHHWKRQSSDDIMQQNGWLFGDGTPNMFGMVYFFKSNSVYKMCNLISKIEWSLLITCQLCKLQSLIFFLFVCGFVCLKTSVLSMLFVFQTP